MSPPDTGAAGVGDPLRNASPAATVESLRARLERAVIGKRPVIDLALTCVLAGGHLLLEDVPGVGKTTLALALARATGGSFRRVQCTADLLPSDVTGGLVLDGTGTMRFRAGPIFANVVLADEINRATPRTQSALLEAMNEAQVSVDGESHALPDPFLVVATQNPLDVHGTFPLPDAQLDRFLVRTSVGYPPRDAERAILRGESDGSAIEAVAPEALAALRAAVRAVTVHPDLEDWVLDLVAASRGAGVFARGVSPRGARALVAAARAQAVLQGRAWVTPEDLRTLVVPVLAHRVLVRDDTDPAAAVRALADSLPAAA